MGFNNRNANIEIKIVVIHRKKCIDLGYQTSDFSSWIDIISQWLFSCGAKEVSFGSADDGRDEIEVSGWFEQEPDELILGDIVMRQTLKSRAPLRLEDHNPYVFRPVLQAWQHVHKARCEEFRKVKDLLDGYCGAIKNVMGNLPIPDPRYHERIEERLRPVTFKADPSDDSDRRESCGA